MWLESQVRSIIEKAANDFDETANQELPVKSQEDGTERGELLDSILAAQKKERDQLWKQLHELEDRHRAEGLQRVFGGRLEANKKQLATLLYEEQELNKELERQMDAVHDLNRPDNEHVAEIQFKDRLRAATGNFSDALKFLENELAEAQATLAKEQIVLKECEDITASLRRKLQEAQQPGQAQMASTRMREKLTKLQMKHNAIMNDLIEFLQMYYPPHQVDRDSSRRQGNDEMCDLKYILEDLMNLSVLKPNEPYLDLVPGTYWSPYIETIVKAGIAVYHPEDSSKLRLVEFRV